MITPPWAEHRRQPPRADGAWIIGETWDPFTRLPDDFCWWRRLLQPNEVVEYQITDDEAAALVTVVQDGITRVPITPLELPRFRVATRIHEYFGWRGELLIASPPLVFLDVLTNLPPARLLPWRALTRPGDTDPPKCADDRSQHGRDWYETDYMTIPLEQRQLDLIRHGRRPT